MATRVTTIGDTVYDLTNTPIAGAVVSITLVSPTGVRPIDNQGITLDPTKIVTITANGSGVWSQVVIPPGDITPAGCYYRVVENGVTINSPSFAYSATEILVSTWFVSASVDATQLLMYIQSEVLNNTYDIQDSVIFSITDNCIWTAKGITLVKNRPYTVQNDNAGKAFAYLVPNALLNPNNVPYQVSFASGQSYFFNVPSNPNQWQGNWSNTTAYVVNDVVNLSGTWYICILNHTGHTPPNATYWALWNGENILNPTGTHLSSGTGASTLTLPPSAISASTGLIAVSSDPVNPAATLDDDIVILNSRSIRNGRSRRLYLASNY